MAHSCERCAVEGIGTSDRSGLHAKDASTCARSASLRSDVARLASRLATCRTAHRETQYVPCVTWGLTPSYAWHILVSPACFERSAAWPLAAERVRPIDYPHRREGP